MAKKKPKLVASEQREPPVAQRDYDVGPKKPPKEYQFQPGQSGNLKGAPKHRTQLWTYFCKFMALTDAELANLDAKSLTQSQQTALKLVKNAKKGKYSGSERLARHIFDREEGKATEYLVVGGTENRLTDEECEDIRKVLRRNHADR